MATRSRDVQQDGRLARSERARAAVIDALLALIEEGDLRPSAARIAERAGVSLRLVFHHFTDLEALFHAASARQFERVAPTLKVIPTTGPLEERLAALVDQRVRLYQRISNTRRAAMLLEPFSEAARTRLTEVRRRGRSEVEAVFRRELDELPPAARKEILPALCATLSFSTFEALHLHQGLPPDEVRKVITRMLRSMLEGGRRQSSGTNPIGGPV